MNLKLIAQHLVPALRQSLRAPGLCLIGLDGGRPPADEEREPWIRIKYGQASADDWVGVVPAMARFSRGRGEPPGTLNLVVKINPRVGLARNLIPWIAARNHIVLERPFLQYRSAAELRPDGSTRISGLPVGPATTGAGRRRAALLRLGARSGDRRVRAVSRMRQRYRRS